MTRANVRVLDGGMGRELKRIGAPFRQPEWSALALIEAPEYVLQAHQAFVKAGARIITTNSYAVVPFHIGDERFAEQGRALAERAGRLARQAAGESTDAVTVAGSLPPALGSYRPDLFDHQRSVAIHRELIAGLQAHVDVWLAETQSSIAEVRWSKPSERIPRHSGCHSRCWTKRAGNRDYAQTRPLLMRLGWRLSWGPGRCSSIAASRK